MAKKKSKKKKVSKQIVLHRNAAIITFCLVNAVVSIFGANAFYNVITKVAPSSYDASLEKTLLTVGPLIFIGVTIVLLFVLLISQTNIED